MKSISKNKVKNISKKILIKFLVGGIALNGYSAKSHAMFSAIGKLWMAGAAVFSGVNGFAAQSENAQNGTSVALANPFVYNNYCYNGSYDLKDQVFLTTNLNQDFGIYEPSGTNGSFINVPKQNNTSWLPEYHGSDKLRLGLDDDKQDLAEKTIVQDEEFDANQLSHEMRDESNNRQSIHVVDNITVSQKDSQKTTPKYQIENLYPQPTTNPFNPIDPVEPHVEVHYSNALVEFTEHGMNTTNGAADISNFDKFRSEISSYADGLDKFGDQIKIVITDPTLLKDILENPNDIRDLLENSGIQNHTQVKIILKKYIKDFIKNDQAQSIQGVKGTSQLQIEYTPHQNQVNNTAVETIAPEVANQVNMLGDQSFTQQPIAQGRELDSNHLLHKNGTRDEQCFPKEGYQQKKEPNPQQDDSTENDHENNSGEQYQQNDAKRNGDANLQRAEAAVVAFLAAKVYEIGKHKDDDAGVKLPRNLSDESAEKDKAETKTTPESAPTSTLIFSQGRNTAKHFQQPKQQEEPQAPRPQEEPMVLEKVNINNPHGLSIAIQSAAMIGAAGANLTLNTISSVGNVSIMNINDTTTAMHKEQIKKRAHGVSSGSEDVDLPMPQAGLWAKLSGGKAHQEKDGAISAFDMSQIAITGGFDLNFADNTIIGIAGTRNEISLVSEDQKFADMNANIFSGYASVRLKSNLILAIQAGKGWFSSKRDSALKLENSFASTNLQYGISLGHGVILAPKLGLDFMQIKDGDKVDDRNFSGSASLSLSKRFKISDEIALTPEIHGGFAGVLNGKERALNISKALSNTPDMGTKHMFGFSAKLEGTNKLELDVGYDYTGWKKFGSHQGYLQVKLKF